MLHACIHHAERWLLTATGMLRLGVLVLKIKIAHQLHRLSSPARACACPGLDAPVPLQLWCHEPNGVPRTDTGQLVYLGLTQAIIDAFPAAATLQLLALCTSLGHTPACANLGTALGPKLGAPVRLACMRTHAQVNLNLQLLQRTGLLLRLGPSMSIPCAMEQAG